MLKLATKSLYWRYENQELACIDLIANLTQSICQECNLDFPNTKLQIILSEIITNAIDHGVLGLKSEIKDSEKGFEAYLLERESRIKSLCSGWVTVSVEKLSNNNIQIAVQDNGAGFNYDGNLPIEGLAGDLSLYGRGLLIVNDLCVSVSHVGSGNCIVIEVDTSVEALAA